MKKTETRYVVERRAIAGKGHSVCGVDDNLKAAKAWRDRLRRLYSGVRFRIVRVTTTREVVR